MASREDLRRLRAALPEVAITLDEPLWQHSSFRIGGPADGFAVVQDAEALARLLQLLTQEGIRHMLVGKGSNLLFSDAGYRGVLIRMDGALAELRVEGERLHAGGGALLAHAALCAREHGLAGMAWSCGIPGTIGGAVYMNAGAYGGEMRDILESALILRADGSEQRTCSAEELRFGYRHSSLQERPDILLAAVLRLRAGDPEAIAEHMQALMTKRQDKQPIEYPSAGSTFKRPTGGYAAALIEEAGLKGLRVGDAQVSEKHSGFIINRGKASCCDVLALIRAVQTRVFEHSGIRLEPEVRIIAAE